jgi:hypothetical protein
LSDALVQAHKEYAIALDVDGVL